MPLPSPVSVVTGLAAALALVGCADEDTPEEQRAALVETLARDLRDASGSALDQAAATCVATELVETVGEDRFDEVVAAAVGDGDPALRDQVVDVFASCDALEPITERP